MCKSRVLLSPRKCQCACDHWGGEEGGEPLVGGKSDLVPHLISR